MSDVKRIKSILTARTPRRPPIPDDNWLSLGCTPLNLAVSDRARGGVAKGMFIWYVGGTGTAKTWFALMLMAEASINKRFKDYRFYYDNAERGMYMNLARYFGSRLADRIEPPPAVGKNIPAGNSSKIEEFYYHLDQALKNGPCVYVLDSMDCLEGAEDEAKFEEVMKSVGTSREGKVSGSYGTAVAKANSKHIKRYMSRLDETGSVLLIINQLRSNIKTGYGYAPPTKAGQGGFAMKHYASVELWTKTVGRLRRTVMGKQRVYGKLIQINVEKNRITGGEDATVVVPFLRKQGIDEVGGCIDYLLDEKHWKAAKLKEGKQSLAVRSDEDVDKRPKVFKAPEFGFVGDREKLVRKIEAEGREAELAKIVEHVWREIDEATTIKRKNRYA